MRRRDRLRRYFLSLEQSAISSRQSVKTRDIYEKFRDLKVWHKSHELTLLIYKETKNFPKEELYGLTSQIRRACSSIPANIAEGCGKSSNADFARFLQIAFGSANELEYHILLARDLEMLDIQIHNNLEERLVEVKKMLASLISKIRTDC